jgi:hypothetical protein
MLLLAALLLRPPTRTRRLRLGSRIGGRAPQEPPATPGSAQDASTALGGRSGQPSLVGCSGPRFEIIPLWPALRPALGPARRPVLRAQPAGVRADRPRRGPSSPGAAWTHRSRRGRRSRGWTGSCDCRGARLSARVHGRRRTGARHGGQERAPRSTPRRFTGGSAERPSPRGKVVG